MKGPTLAYRHLKTALRDGLTNSLDAQLALEAKLQGACGQTADFAEGVAAFLAKRPAPLRLARCFPRPLPSA